MTIKEQTTEEIVNYQEMKASILVNDTCIFDETLNIYYSPLKSNPDVLVSFSQERYEPNKLHTVHIKKGEIEFFRDWQEDRDFSSLEELFNLQKDYITEQLRKLK